MNDSEIVHLFQNSDATKERAFNLLLATYQRSMYLQIRRMIISHDDTQDVLQNVCIKIWKGLSAFKQESKLSTWIYRICYNESINFIQAQKKIKRLLYDPTEDENKRANIIESTLRAEPYFNADELQVKFQTAINLLPEKQKAVFMMKYYDDITYEEMAAIMDTSVGALKASYHHAVKKIEQFLKLD